MVEIDNSYNHENKRHFKEKEDQYSTKGGYKIPYQLTLGFFDEPGGSDIQRKTDQESNPTIRKLKEGEFAAVEIKYSVDKNFPFTGSSKIESYEDVAFLFRKLQQSAVENAFAVYVKKEKPIIQHLSMGSNVGTIIWFNAIFDGISRFKPDKVYFVHNHPSGSLQPSDHDVKIYKKLKNYFPSLIQEAIIIDIDSGYFATFSSKNEVLLKCLDKTEDVKHKVLKFDKQVFNKNVFTSKITSSLDAASYVASQRLSNGNKLSILILDRKNQINANIHLPYSDFEHPDLFNDVMSYVSRFGGLSVVFYGRFNPNEHRAQEIKRNFKDLGIELLDVINIKSSPEIFVQNTSRADYVSYADEGLLEEQYRYAVSEAEALYKVHSSQGKRIENKIPGVNDLKEDDNQLNKESYGKR